MKSLGMELLMPPTFNVETGTFDDPQYVDARGNVLSEDDMDVFDLARIKGTTVSKLKQMDKNYNRQVEEDAKLVNSTGQRHSKKDYDKLNSISIHNIVMSTNQRNVKKAFEDDTIHKEIVKIEKKKGFKRSAD